MESASQLLDRIAKLQRDQANLKDRVTELKKQRAAAICPPGHRYVPEHCIAPPNARPKGRTKGASPTSQVVPDVSHIISKLNLQAELKRNEMDVLSAKKGPGANERLKQAHGVKLVDIVLEILPVAAQRVAAALLQGKSSEAELKRIVSAAVAGLSKYSERMVEHPALLATALQIGHQLATAKTL